MTMRGPDREIRDEYTKVSPALCSLCNDQVKIRYLRQNSQTLQKATEVELMVDATAKRNENIEIEQSNEYVNVYLQRGPALIDRNKITLAMERLQDGCLFAQHMSVYLRSYNVLAINVSTALACSTYQSSPGLSNVRSPPCYAYRLVQILATRNTSEKNRNLPCASSGYSQCPFENPSKVVIVPFFIS